MSIKINQVRTLVPFLLLSLVIGLQYSFDIQKTKRPLTKLTVIPAQAIKIGDLGLHSAAASMIWLQTIQELAPHTNQLPQLIKTVNDLDPKFGYPYAFAALILPPLGSPEQAIEISLRGIQKANADWRIPYYLATSYHIFFEDRKNAAFYFDLAARTKNSPENIIKISSRYGIGQTSREQMKEIWKSIYDFSEDEIIRKRSTDYLAHIEIVEFLEKAIFLYKQKYGISPNTLDELVSAKILRKIPPSPLGVAFNIKYGQIFIY